MSGRIRTTVLVASAFLAGVFVAGGVGFAQQPCPSPTPAVVAAPDASAPEAIEWFRQQGFLEDEASRAGYWSAMYNWINEGYVWSVMVTSDGDELTSIYVDESSDDLAFVREVITRFVPEASTWLETALLTPPGESVQETFGDADIDLSMSQVSGTRGAAVSITYD